MVSVSIALSLSGPAGIRVAPTAAAVTVDKCSSAVASTNCEHQWQWAGT